MIQKANRAANSVVVTVQEEAVRAVTRGDTCLQKPTTIRATSRREGILTRTRSTEIRLTSHMAGERSTGKNTDLSSRYILNNDNLLINRSLSNATLLL
jgi:hypothetical protein